MQEREFIVQFSELVRRVKAIERWMDQWGSRDRKVQALITNAIQLKDPTTDYFAIIRSGSNLPASVTWYFPASDGNDGQVLVTNGSGALFFSSSLEDRIDNADAGIADIRSVIRNFELAIDGIRDRLNALEADSHTHDE